jgi:hypothetical protein
MGLIHTRASKKRDAAQAKLLEEEIMQHRREEAGDSLLRQPTVGDLIRKIWQRRRARRG